MQLRFTEIAENYVARQEQQNPDGFAAAADPLIQRAFQTACSQFAASGNEEVGATLAYRRSMFPPSRKTLMVQSLSMRHSQLYLSSDLSIVQYYLRIDRPYNALQYVADPEEPL